MDISNTLCMNCMKDTGGEQECPHCGFQNAVPQELPFLPLRTVLSDRYVVGRMLRHDSDCAVYAGFDLSQKAPVYVHEFLPKGISSRTRDTNDIKVRANALDDFEACLQSFLELWRNLARLRSLSAVIPVYDIFEENGTAYAVGEYMECVPLREYLLKLPTGYLPWDKAKILFMPVLSTLGALHSAGIIHRAINPNTLLICKDGRMRLGGFRIWQACRVGTPLQAQLESGYAAIEQYHAKEQQGAWTDIYGFAASLYRTLVGNTPPEAPLRVENDKLMVPARLAEQIPAYVINALSNGLQIFPAERTKTVDQLRAELSAAPSVTMAQTVPQPEPVKAPDPAAPAPRHNNRKVAIVSAIAGGLIVLAAVVLLVVFRDTLFGGFGADVPQTTGTEMLATQTTGSTMVEVPDFLNQVQASIQNNASWNSKFTFEYTYEFSDTYESGRVIRQSVKKGSKVNQGTAILLTVSKGKEQVVLSNMVGWKINDAQKELVAKGFQVTILTITNDGSHPEGEVASMVPQAGRQYYKGQEVILQVYGPAPTVPAQSDTPAGSPTRYRLQE